MKTVKILFGFVISIIIFGCAMHDFSHHVFEEYYQGPIITVLSPTNGDNFVGYATLSLLIEDETGVSRVEIFSENNNINITFPDGLTSVEITTNIYFYSESYKNIEIRAYDQNEAEGRASVGCQIYYYQPTLNVNFPNPWSTFYTNVSEILVRGTATYSDGYIDRVELYKYYDGTNEYFSAAGFDPWMSWVTLSSNQENNIIAYAYNDRGCRAEQNFQVVMDAIDPVVSYIYPTTEMTEMPSAFNLMIEFIDDIPLDYLSYGIREYGFSTNVYGESYVYKSFNLPDGNYTFWALAKDVAGNITSTNEKTLNVSKEIPSVNFDQFHIKTNATSLNISGWSEVSNIATISSIEINVNNTGYQTVDAFENTSFTYWTNFNTTLIANQDNIVKVRATSSAGKTFEWETHIYVDTIAPVFNEITPANNSITNSGSYSYSFRVSDEMSGFKSLRIIQVAADIVGTTNTIYSGSGWWDGDIWCYNNITPYYGDEGLVMTNIITAWDNAGNYVENITVITLLPYLYVSAVGSTENVGTEKYPFGDIQEALAYANQYGLQIRLIEGNYTPGNGLESSGVGLLIDGGSYTIYGGWRTNENDNLGITCFDGNNTLPTLLKIQNTGYMYIDNIDFINARSTAGTDVNRNGAVEIENCSSVQIYNSAFSNNQMLAADSKGGGVYFNNSYNSFLNNCVVAYNTAAYGGGVYVEGNSVSLSGSMIVGGNLAMINGGGVYINGNDNSIYGEYILNACSNAGGGVYMTGANNYLGVNVISNNVALQYGGGLAVINANAGNLAGMVSENISSNQGGGVYVKNSEGFYMGTTVRNNSAVNFGGGFYFEGANGLTIGFSTINENMAVNGAAIYAINGQFMTVNNSTFNLNNALADNSIVYVKDVENFELNANQILDNQFNPAMGTISAILKLNDTGSLFGLKIFDNTFSIVGSTDVYSIYEETAVNGHLLENNIFNTNDNEQVYYDTVNSDLFIDDLNDPALTGASSAVNNIEM